MYSWDVLNDNVKSAKMLLTIAEPCLNHEFPRWKLKNFPCSENFRVSSCFYDMEGHVKKCVERHCELAYKTVSEQISTIDFKMVQSLLQTIESFNILHPSHMWIHIVLLCG